MLVVYKQNVNCLWCAFESWRAPGYGRARGRPGNALLSFNWVKSIASLETNANALENLASDYDFTGELLWSFVSAILICFCEAGNIAKCKK